MEDDLICFLNCCELKANLYFELQSNSRNCSCLMFNFCLHQQLSWPFFYCNPQMRPISPSPPPPLPLPIPPTSPTPKLPTMSDWWSLLWGLSEADQGARGTIQLEQNLNWTHKQKQLTTLTTIYSVICARFPKTLVKEPGPAHCYGTFSSYAVRTVWERKQKETISLNNSRTTI